MPTPMNLLNEPATFREWIHASIWRLCIMFEPSPRTISLSGGPFILQRMCLYRPMWVSWVQIQYVGLPSDSTRFRQVTQKKDIKRQKDRLASLKKEAEEERGRARQAARERVLEEFERGQLGLSGGVSSFSGKAKATAESDERKWSCMNISGTQTKPLLTAKTGSKRKFEFSADTVKALAAEAEEAAMKQIEKEQAAALKAKLPDFWLPSLTPTYKANLSEPKTVDDLKVQSHTMCRGGVESHPIAYVIFHLALILR